MLLVFLANAEEYFGVAFNDNHTGTGLVGDIIERRAEVAMGGVLRWHRNYKFLKYSNVIQQTHTMHLAPIVKPLPSFLIPLRPFPLSVWFILATTYVVGMVLIYATRKLLLTMFGHLSMDDFNFDECVVMVLKCASFQGASITQ